MESFLFLFLLYFQKKKKKKLFNGDGKVLGEGTQKREEVGERVGGVV